MQYQWRKDLEEGNARLKRQFQLTHWQDKWGHISLSLATFPIFNPTDRKKYLSTDLVRKEPPADDDLSPYVELRSYRAFNRAFSLYED